MIVSLFENIKMTAYWVAHVDVQDPDIYAEYAKRATAAIESHGGRFLARATKTVWLEGNERARNVVIEFPDVQSAEDCYNSAAYQEAVGFAKRSAVRDLCIIEGN
ncbi:MAG: hypothetical protein ACI845_001358 [Gammaproteobacteria bacterium]